MSIKIGNLDIASIKVGSADCKVYIGNELLYPSGFTGKFKATYASGPDYTLNCDGDTTLTTGNTKPSGYEYSAMTEAVIGDCVTSIGSSAFYGCSSLTAIDIPNSVTSIGSQAFDGCLSLTSIIIPNSVTSIGSNAFYGCTSLTDCTIGSGVTSIGGYAFRYCSSLTSIDIPSSVTTIGNGAFQGCSGLTSITVDSNNTNYDSRNNCNAIIETSTNKLIFGCQNTIIPNSVTSIGTSAFTRCYGLTSITIPSSVTDIGISAFNGCSSLTAIDIPNSVTSIGNSAFSGCTSLTTINIPSGVTSIGNSAFQNCTSLTSINIPSGVTNIGISAFKGCSGLTSISIPSGVTRINSGAFSGCSSLTAITVNATTPPTGGTNVFDNSNDCPIYVPAESVEIYKHRVGWSTYASRIVAIPTPSLTWVQFNSGDTINGLNYYGIRGAANDISNTFTVVAGEDIVCDYIRNVVEVTISNCHSETITPPETNVEYVFSNLGCADYYTINNLQTAYSSFELLIMQ